MGTKKGGGESTLSRRRGNLQLLIPSFIDGRGGGGSQPHELGNFRRAGGGESAAFDS